MYWENISTPVSGKAFRMASAARSPSSVWVGGIRMSTTATSGWCSATAASSASPSVTAAHTEWPRSSSRRVSPSRSSASSSAITTRITVLSPRTRPPLGLQWQLDTNGGRAAGRAGHINPPVYRGHSLGQAGQAAALSRVRPADAVVGDLKAENAGPFGINIDFDLVCVTVLGRVGNQLSRAEIGDGLDGRRGPVADLGGDRRGDGAAGGQGGQRARQAVVQSGRVDAAGQVTQVGERVHRVAVRGVEQLPHRRMVGAGDIVVVAQLLPRHAEVHGQR